MVLLAQAGIVKTRLGTCVKGGVLVSVRRTLVPGARFCLYRTASRSGSVDALRRPCETLGANAHSDQQGHHCEIL